MNKQYCFLLLFVLACLPAAWAQNELLLNWANAINHPQILGGFIQGRSIAVDAMGNTYVTGNFINTADFDPSPAVASLTSRAGSDDIFFAKYDALGNYVYAKGIEGVSGEQSFGIAVDNMGNVYITGNFQTTVDFDPSPAVNNLTSGSYDIFLAKYDASGNYIYAKSFGGSGFDYGYDIAIDGSGNACVVGHFDGTADFDPSGAVANLTSAGGSDVFVAKYDASGNYVYAKSIAGTAHDYGYSIAADGIGNVYLTGRFSSTADFDPSSGVANLSSAGNDDIFIAKYDSSGNYVYAKRMGSSGADQGLSIAVDSSGNAYLTGRFQGTVDFDPSGVTANLISAGNLDVFFAKYDASGNYVYAKALGGTNSDYGTGIAVDGSGNAYVTGYFWGTADFDPSTGVSNLTSVGTSDIFLAKYDVLGNYVYARRMGGSMDDHGISLTVDGSGNTYMTGYFMTAADFDPSAGTANLVAGLGGADCFIGKYNSVGNYVWAKSLGGYNNQTFTAQGNGITSDALGNTYVVGDFTGTVDFDPSAGVATLTSAGQRDVFLAKYNASGNYVYAKAFGGVSYDQGMELGVDGSGNVYITGYFEGTANFNPPSTTANLVSTGGRDIFLAKYDASGNYVYAKGFGGTYDDYGLAVAIDANGKVYLTGSFQGTVDFDSSIGVANLTSAGGSDIFIVKYDASGNYEYAKAFGGTNEDEGTGIVIDSSGNAHLTGSFEGTADFDPSAAVMNMTSAGGSDIFLAKYNTLGNYMYAKRIGGIGDDWGSSLAVDSTGKEYITGHFQDIVDFDPSVGVANLTTAGGNDIFLAKYDASGNYLYAKNMGGTGRDGGAGVAVDGSGNAYVTGTFVGTADFDPSTGVVNLIGAGGYDIFLAKYDPAGNYVYAKAIGEPRADFGYDIAINGSDVYLTGSFQDVPDFDPSAATYNLRSINEGAAFVARYNGTGTTAGVNDFVLNNLKLYPNPVTDILNIESEQTISDIEVYSIMGQRVMVKAVNAMSASIHMSALTGGIYLVKVVADEAVKAIKVIKK